MNSHVSTDGRGHLWSRRGIIALLLVCLALSAFAQGPDRSQPPKAGPPPHLKLPPIQHLKLSNGLPVVLLEKHQVPLVQIVVLLRTGSAMDPRAKAGRASMTADLLTEGAGPRDALQLADAIDYLGAQLDASAGMHNTTVGIFTPLTKLDSALALLADVTLRPTFPQSELDRKKKEWLTALLQWRDEPRQLVGVEFNRLLFGDGHPYGVPTMGDEKSIRSLTVNDLRQFHADFFVANNATLIVVGDITPASVMPKLEAAFGSWKSGTVPATTLGRILQVENRSVTLIDKPDAPQSEIRIGRIGVPRLTDDYYALVVMNTILGGSFTSRLNQNLRETHGYTYGAGSRFDFRMLAGPFIAYSAVQTAVTDKALTEFMNELNGIVKGVTDAEVERAKNYIALSFPGEFQTVSQIANGLEELVIYGLPDSYVNDYIEKILSVTRQDVERVARKYIDPAKIAIVISGDKAKIESGITALNLGSLKVLTVEDVLGKAPDVGK
jgi:zinc protease